jgi:uncharacterized protein with LGFP repeats
MKTHLLIGFVGLGLIAGCSASPNDDAATGSQDFSTPSGTACLFGLGTVSGMVEQKYLSLGGCTSFLGPPTTNVLPTPDGRGFYAAFYNGSIYYRPDLGAFVVRGEIRELWKSFGWEEGPLGYPLTDETLTPDGRGRYGVFEGGSIYWTMTTGAHEVRGAIRDKWRDLGWEAGPLGYPVAGEVQLPTGVRSDFEHGSITWTRATGEVTVSYR